MAAYTMDSYNCQRIVIEKDGVKMVKNDGDVQVGGFPPYPISYRSLVPKDEQCKNLLVPVCLSASHIAYGSIRMEPVFMVMGPSAAIAAALAIDKNVAVQNVNVQQIQDQLKKNPLADGSLPDILVDNDNSNNVQQIGSWKRNSDSKNSYASSWFESDETETGFKAIKFILSFPKANKYKVYTYVPKIANASSTLAANIFDGKKIKKVTINQREIKVEGQTSGEWAYLGEYNFVQGSKGYVEITNLNADGTVIADAVLFVPVRM